MIRRSPRTGLPLIAKTSPERSVRCGDSPPAALLAGIAQFNAGDFWECHETLEALWRGEPDAIRSLYQGILLVGVGYYHLERGNTRGAVIKLRQGLECLEPFRPACMGIAVEELVASAAGAIRNLSDRSPSDPGEREVAVPPHIRLL